MKRIGQVVCCLLMMLAVVWATSISKTSTRLQGMLPSVAALLEVHPEFGSPRLVGPSTPWAVGLRQEVKFGDGRVLSFYEKNGLVVTVWNMTPGEPESVVWRRP